MRVTLLLCIILETLTSSAQDRPFSRHDPPNYPGDRKVSVLVELGASNSSNVDIQLYYSQSKTEVERNLASTGFARKVDVNVDGKIKAEFIFPHRDHANPNITDVRSKIYDHTDPVIYYKWVRRIKNGNNYQYVDDEIRELKMPRLFIIGYLGDSFAAGEGAPDSEDDKWIDDDCHRSEKSGGVRAIKKLIQVHPEYAIRYQNVACSGATIGDFVLADIRDDWFGMANWSKEPQLLQLQNWMNRTNRKVVDIILMGIGGNDIGFGPIGTSTFVAGTSNLEEVKEAARAGLSALPNGYNILNDAIRGDFDFEVGRILIFNYPDPTRQANGRFCNPFVPGFCWGPIERRISENDFEFLYQDFLQKLNNEVGKAAERHGWDLVDIMSKSRQHGLCNCEEPYFNTLGQSFGSQGDIQGTIHPNATGYRVIYRDAIYNQLLVSMDKWRDELKDEAIRRAKEKARQKLRDRENERKLYERLFPKQPKIAYSPITDKINKIPIKLQEEDKGKSKDKGLGKD